MQEQSQVLIANTASMTLINGANVTVRFTEVSLMAAASSGRRLIPDLFNNTVAIQNSQLRGIYWSFYNYTASGNPSPKIYLTNNILERCTIDWTQGYAITPFDPYYLYLAWYNNLFSRCSVTLRHFGTYYGSWDIYDNLFDSCTVSKTEYGQGSPYGSALTTVGYNGYTTSSAPLGGSGNKTGLVPDYQTGPLGMDYYPATGGSSSLASLINTGSRTPASAGLYHFTVKTPANTKEGTDSPQTVDIGFHYMGVNASNLPLDDDGDSVADYLEDRNGNGTYQTGETFNWQLANTDGVGNGDLQEYELSFNILVNDAVQDYAKEQNTQFESTCAVLNGNVIVAYVDSNQGVYALGSDSRLSSLTPQFAGYSVSRDNGVTFEDKGVPPLSTQGAGTSDDGDAGDPVLAVDKTSSIVYMVGTSPRNSGWNGIPLWKSIDGGIIFGTPITVHSEISSTDKPWITVDNGAGTGQGDVYVVFTGFGAFQRLWLTVSTDNGANWSTLQQIQVDGAANQVQSAIPVIGPDHVAYVFWWEQQPSSDGINYPNHLKVRASQNRGANLGTIHNIRQLVTTDGIYGNLHLKRSNSAADSDNFRAFPFPVPAANPDPAKANHLYVAYADKAQNPDPNDRADVFFVRSTDGGANWTSPVRVSTISNNDQWMPVIAVKPDGTKLFMAWYDRRNDANNSLIDVYGRWATISTDGTVTFGTEFKISTTSFPPVFAGTLADNTIQGHYDPVYPLGGVNLNWHYGSAWPPPPPPPEIDGNITAAAYRDHVGEYDGAWAGGQYVYMTWTDNRSTASGTSYARNQRDIRIVRITWPQ